MNREMKRELMLVPHHNVIESIPIHGVAGESSVFEVRRVCTARLTGSRM